MTLAAHAPEAVFDVAFALLLLALLGAFVRVLRGPSLADRVIALDLLSITLVAFAGVYAAQTGEVAFFTTVVFARYIEQRSDTSAPESRADPEEPR